jgi:hypothetical protein
VLVTLPKRCGALPELFQIIPKYSKILVIFQKSIGFLIVFLYGYSIRFFDSFFVLAGIFGIFFCINRV